MMLRNVPCKYTQDLLRKEIDNLGFEGTYDYLFLPMDRAVRNNVGYAFVNFERPEDAVRFHFVFTDHRFQFCGSCKTGVVRTARLQGLNENIGDQLRFSHAHGRDTVHAPIIMSRGRQTSLTDAMIGVVARDRKWTSSVASASTAASASSSPRVVPVCLPPAAPTAPALVAPAAAAEREGYVDLWGHGASEHPGLEELVSALHEVLTQSSAAASGAPHSGGPPTDRDLQVGCAARYRESPRCSCEPASPGRYGPEPGAGDAELLSLKDRLAKRLRETEPGRRAEVSTPLGHQPSTCLLLGDPCFLNATDMSSLK